MFNENKIIQVVNAINENRLEAMDDESLARLLAILSPREFDYLNEIAFEKLGGKYATRRISKIKSLVRVMVNNELYKIRNSDYYMMFMESLTNGRYIELFTKLTDEELGNLKKYVYNSVSINNEMQTNAAKKIIKIIANEIAKRDTIKKPHFE